MAKRDNDYQRCGTANIFGIVEPKAGHHFTCATSNRSAAQFAEMIRTVVTAYPRARTIHMVLDNLNIHCEQSLTKHFGRRTGRRIWRRLTVHYKLLRLATPYLTIFVAIAAVWTAGAAIAASPVGVRIVPVVAILMVPLCLVPQVRRVVRAQIAWGVALQSSIVVATINGVRGRWDV